MRTRMRGFTLVEVLVALAIIATLVAVLYPALSGKVRDSRTAALLQTFQGYAQGVAEFKKGTTRYPSSLLLLTAAPTATSLDICGNQAARRGGGDAVRRGANCSGIVIGSTGIQLIFEISNRR